MVVRSSVRNNASSGPILESAEATSLKLCVPVGQSEHVPCSKRKKGTQKSAQAVSAWRPHA